MQCAPEQLVPQGPNVDPAYQGCALTGASPNSNAVAGSDYLQTSFNYSRSNLWRNFGVVIAFGILYLVVTVIGTETLSFSKSGGGALIFKKSKRAKKAVKEETTDEEKVVSGESSGASSEEPGADEEALESISSSESVFTWKDVEYTVPYQGGERKLLNKVNGYAKPGVMVALVGASGAGKTTLLNTLSQRQSTGVVSGEMLVDGKDLGKVSRSLIHKPEVYMPDLSAREPSTKATSYSRLPNILSNVLRRSYEWLLVHTRTSR